jgi:hypothetical protein
MVFALNVPFAPLLPLHGLALMLEIAGNQGRLVELLLRSGP